MYYILSPLKEQEEEDDKQIIFDMPPKFLLERDF